MPSSKLATKPRQRTKSGASASASPWQPKVVAPVLSPARVEQTLADAFPDVDPGLRPYGSRVLIQIRTPRERSEGGVYLSDDTQDTEKWNTTIAKIVAMGPGAFRNRDTLQIWPEGEWAKVGEFVWCPKYAGQRHQLKIRGKRTNAMFVTVNDLDLIGACMIDPLSVVMFI